MIHIFFYQVSLKQLLILEIMKKIILSLTFALVATFTFAQSDYKGEKFGEEVKPGNINAVAKVESVMGDNKTANMKVEGKVIEVCKKKGCWMVLETPDGKGMRVTFKDYGFFMPKDIAGRTVVIEGLAKRQTISVEKLRHYAEDAKKSPEEVAKITEPKKEIAFVANGVILLDK